MKFSRFPDAYTNVPTMLETTWSEFADYLALAATVKAAPCDKASTSLVSPAQYEAGATRANANVLGWDWVGLDVDSKGPQIFAPTVDDAVQVIDSLGLAHVVYSTTSSTVTNPCFRIVVPLQRMISAAEHAPLWSALDQLFCGWLDPKSKDVSRLLVEPRNWIGADNRLEVCVEGKALDPDWVLAMFPPLVAEPWDYGVSANGSDHTSPQNANLDDPKYRHRAERYSAAIVANRCKDIINAAHGSQNSTIYRSAATLGGLVAGGLIGEGEAFDVLMDAARAGHHPQSRARATIRSGLTAGKRSPIWGPPTDMLVDAAAKRRRAMMRLHI